MNEWIPFLPILAPCPVWCTADFLTLCIRGGLLQPLHLDPQWSFLTLRIL
jgi:hypothetical protein